MKRILPTIHLLQLGSVNAYLVEHGDFTLIDTGYSGSLKGIFAYLEKLGKRPSDITSIILTHMHSDHAGSVAAIKAATQAEVYMHPADARLVAQGQCLREHMQIAPGLLNTLIYHLAVKKAPKVIEPVETNHFIHDQEVIPLGKGFKVIHIPGHSQGQVALLYQDYGGVLFAADACANSAGLAISPFNENTQQCLTDLTRLCVLDFQVATFGHGKPIASNASQKFKQKWGKKN